MRTTLQTYRPTTLYSEIFSVKKPTTEKINKMYGSFGVEIFQGGTPTLLTKRDKMWPMRLYNNVKSILGIGTAKSEYNFADTMKGVMLKYMGNKGKVTSEEITERFGKKGQETLRSFRLLGYAEKVIP